MKRRFGFKHALRQRIQNNCKRDSSTVIDMNTAIAHTVESALRRNWPWSLESNRRADECRRGYSVIFLVSSGAGTAPALL
jgi:hypothetical protein